MHKPTERVYCFHRTSDMLALFPSMFLSLFAHTLLRVVFGGILLYLAWRHLVICRTSLQTALRPHWYKLTPFVLYSIGISELLLGALFLLGALTQAAALGGIVLSIKMLLLRRRFPHPSIPPPLFYILALGVSLSLLITGAGAFAIDLPL